MKIFNTIANMFASKPWEVYSTETIGGVPTKTVILENINKKYPMTLKDKLLHSGTYEECINYINEKGYTIR